MTERDLATIIIAAVGVLSYVVGIAVGKSLERSKDKETPPSSPEPIQPSGLKLSRDPILFVDGYMIEHCPDNDYHKLQPWGVYDMKVVLESDAGVFWCYTKEEALRVVEAHKRVRIGLQ